MRRGVRQRCSGKRPCVFKLEGQFNILDIPRCHVLQRPFREAKVVGPFRTVGPPLRPLEKKTRPRVL